MINILMITDEDAGVETPLKDEESPVWIVGWCESKVVSFGVEFCWSNSLNV